VSILARYLTREILGSTVLALCVLLLLFSFLDLISEIPDIKPPTYTLGKVMLYILLRVPGHLQELLPVAAIVGALFALARLAASSEFTVMRTSGLSSGRLVSYLLAMGVLLGGLLFLLGEYVSPHADRAAQQLKVRATTGVVAQQFRTGLWAKDGGNFINIQGIQSDATLLNLRVYVFDDKFRLKTIRDAKHAAWQADGSWLLRDVVQTHIDERGTRIERLGRLSWRTDVNPDLLAVLMIPPEQMSLRTLKAYIDHLAENRQKTTRYETAYWNKIAFPLAAPIMLLIALPFAYHSPRSANVSSRVLAGILIGLGFHLLSRLSGHLGLLNDWPPAVGPVATLGLFTLGALIALWRAERV
jgi:lipopolysaccharide export system permease protein